MKDTLANLLLVFHFKKKVAQLSPFNISYKNVELKITTQILLENVNTENYRKSANKIQNYISLIFYCSKFRSYFIHMPILDSKYLLLFTFVFMITLRHQPSLIQKVTINQQYLDLFIVILTRQVFHCEAEPLAWFRASEVYRSFTLVQETLLLSNSFLQFNYYAWI